MGRTRQHWTVELLDEAINAVGDRLAILSNTDGTDRQQIIRLQQAARALRDDRAIYWHREARNARKESGRG